VWWSRLAQPALHTWADDDPLRLVQQTVAKDDPDPKALASYGLLLRPDAAAEGAAEELWLRFVDGRPVSAITIQFLSWCCDRLAAAGVTTLVLIWDNASWHVSGAVRTWLRAHNQRVQREGGVRIVPCLLPKKSPWLNPIEPQWVHAKRRIVEPARLLTARELEERVCAAFACSLTAHLTIPKEVS
jgi:transposase